jgi:hypothetical protein
VPRASREPADLLIALRRGAYDRQAVVAHGRGKSTEDPSRVGEATTGTLLSVVMQLPFIGYPAR